MIVKIFLVFFLALVNSSLKANTKALITNCGPTTIARVCIYSGDANLYSEAGKTYVLAAGETIYFTCQDEACRMRVFNGIDGGCHYSTKVYTVEDGASYVIRAEGGARDPKVAESNEC